MFGTHSRKAISAIKSAHVHLLEAAGGIEAIFAILALRDQVAPATLNLKAADSAADGLDLVHGEARQMPTDYSLSNGFGFRGVTARVLFRRGV